MLKRKCIGSILFLLPTALLADDPAMASLAAGSARAVAVPEALRPVAVAALARRRAPGPVLVVTPTTTAGGQGGYHIWISIRCGTCGPEVIASYGVDDAETGELLTFQGLQEWKRLEENGGWREAVGMIGFLTDNDPSVYEGRRVRLWASAGVQGSGDPPLEAEAEATALDD